MKLNHPDCPELIQFALHKDLNGALCAYQAQQHVPFNIRRVFTVTACKDDVRGKHAHKQCTQLLICVSGRIRTGCDDGQTVTQFTLDDMSVGLLIPPGIWAEEEYLSDGAVLMVLCDRDYDADDYIRDYNEFKHTRNDREGR